jgi:hypothetical protein
MSRPTAPADPPLAALTRAALGFDLEAELDLCRHLAATGGSASVRAVFAPNRAARLFQALLSTGRHQALDEHWRDTIETGIRRGTLAPPDWN